MTKFLLVIGMIFSSFVFSTEAVAEEIFAPIELSSVTYRLQFRDSSLWVTQGSYGSESSVMNALNDYSRRAGKKLWRVVLEDNGRVIVLVTIQT